MLIGDKIKWIVLFTAILGLSFLLVNRFSNEPSRASAREQEQEVLTYLPYVQRTLPDTLPRITVSNATINENGNVVTVLISLTGSHAEAALVDYATMDGTAVAGQDYTAVSGSLSWPANETGVKVIQIPISEDTLYEGEETFVLLLSSPVNATIVNGQGNISIIDNDPSPTITVSDAIVTEGAGATASITVSLSTVSGAEIMLHYTTSDGTAVAGTDYSNSSGTVSWSVGESGPKPIRIPILNDNNPEPDETFTVILSSSQATLPDNTAKVTILDDDSLLNLRVEDVSVDETSQTVSVTVRLTGENINGASVAYSTIGDSATPVVDYTPITGTLSWPANVTGTQTVQVPILDDQIDEVNETFFVGLSNAMNATIADGQGVVTILDDDIGTSLTIANVNVTENSNQATLTVQMTGTSPQTVTVDLGTVDGTAVAGSDYLAANGTLTWPPNNNTPKSFTVSIIDDAIYEQGSEAFQVVLSNPVNGAITNGTAVVTITDNDPLPTLTIADMTVIESVGVAQIAVSLSSANAAGVSVDYAPINGTATAGTDYTAINDTLTWSPNETGVKTIAIPILDDAIAEPSELFYLQLFNVLGATIMDGQSDITITDNDPTPTITIEDVTVLENAGTAQFAVTLNGGSSLGVSVDVVSVDETATAGQDYTAVSQVLTWLPGQTGTQTVAVSIIDDVLDEPNETFHLQLSNATNAIIVDAQGVATILDDDLALSLSIADLTINEETGVAVVSVTLVGMNGLPISVDYATQNETAVAPGDYTATNGTLSWAANETGTKQFSVPIVDETIYELNETFKAVLSNPVNVTISRGTGIVTLVNNDIFPSLSINNVNVNETEGVASLSVTLDGGHYLGVSVRADTADNTAVSTEDYTAIANLSLNWAPDETGTKVINVSITNDTVYELTELFNVNLSSPNHATLANAQGDVTVISEDTLPSLAVLDNAVTEGGAVGVIVRVTGTSSQPMSVNYVTADGTATVAGSDYIPLANQTFSWPAYDSTDRVAVVSTNQDVIYEQPSENFKVYLSAPVGATISDNTANITITDDDTVPTLSIVDLVVLEDDNAGTNAVVAVTLSGASSLGVTVRLDTSTSGSPNPATAGVIGDYIAQTNQTLTWLPDETGVKNITILINEDNIDEPDQPFNIDLSTATNATITDNQGVVTIQDNDSAPTLTIADAGMSEGSGGGTANYNYQVLLTGASHWGVTVNCSTISGGGTATPGTDYTTVTNFTLSWNPNVGDTTRNCVIPIVKDSLDEDNETVQVDLSTPTFATIVDGTGILTIMDDDALPVISIAGVTVNEQDGVANLTVTLTPASGRTVTVPYATANGTASAGVDYTTSNGIITWITGQTSQTIAVPILESHSYEGDETFTVALGVPTNANTTITGNPATVTIKDDKDKPTIFAQNTVVNENVAAGTVTVNLIIVGDRDIPITVNYTTLNGTATNSGGGADYTTTTGSKTFAAGLSGTPSQSFTVPIGNTLGAEPTEYFTIDLTTTSSPANAANLVDGTVTIIDEDNSGGPLDGLETLYYVQDTWFDECSPTSDVNLLIVNPATANNTTVTYNTSSAGTATATAPGDYTAVPSTIWTHAIAGSDVFPVTITVAQDANPADLHVEMFFINLSAPGPNNGGINGKDPQVPPSPLVDQGRVFILNCYP